MVDGRAVTQLPMLSQTLLLVLHSKAPTGAAPPQASELPKVLPLG